MNYTQKDVCFLSLDMLDKTYNEDTLIQTKYHYTYRISPLKGVPALCINTFTRIAFNDSEELGAFGCMVTYFFPAGYILKEQEVVDLAKECKKDVDPIFKEKALGKINYDPLEIEEMNEQQDRPQIRNAIVGGSQLN